MNRNRLALTIALGLLAAPPGVLLSEPDYFPLEVENRWTYVVEHPRFTGSREISVESEENGLFLVRTRSSGPGPAESAVRLAARGDEVLIELAREGLVPYYRFAEDSWIHRDPSGCDDGAIVKVMARDEVVETPAGVFTDCLKLEFQGICTDAGLIAQWWAPDVGLVKSEEDNIAGAVTWLLSDFALAGLGRDSRFRRGDANDDGQVDISDMVRMLTHLFLGAPGPDCPDIIDINDDGAIDIADAVFGLGYLFLGGPAPPAPGPQVPGYDGTPADPFTCGDPPPGSLPGVSLDLSGSADTITLAEAAAGVLFRYEVAIEKDLEGVVSAPLDAGRCDQPEASGLRILERISGDGQLYCLCDTGHCRPPGTDPATLKAGRYGGSFEWTGRNWQGSSDTGNPMGGPFPPGSYTFEIRARGFYSPGEECPACQVPFEITATVAFELVP